MTLSETDNCLAKAYLTLEESRLQLDLLATLLMIRAAGSHGGDRKRLQAAAESADRAAVELRAGMRELSRIPPAVGAGALRKAYGGERVGSSEDRGYTPRKLAADGAAP